MKIKILSLILLLSVQSLTCTAKQNDSLFKIMSGFESDTEIYNPKLSPDSNFVAFIKFSEYNFFKYGEVWIHDFKNKKDISVLNENAQIYSVDGTVVWLPNSKSVLLSSKDVIYEYELDSQVIRKLYSSSRSRNEVSINAPEINSDGSKLAFWDADYRERKLSLSIKNLLNDSIDTLLVESFVVGESTFINPLWTNDDKKLFVTISYEVTTLYNGVGRKLIEVDMTNNNSSIIEEFIYPNFIVLENDKIYYTINTPQDGIKDLVSYDVKTAEKEMIVRSSFDEIFGIDEYQNFYFSRNDSVFVRTNERLEFIDKGKNPTVQNGILLYNKMYDREAKKSNVIEIKKLTSLRN